MKTFTLIKANPWLRKLLTPLAFYGLCALIFFWREEIASISLFLFGLAMLAYFALIPLAIALFVTQLCKTIIEKDKLNLIPTIVHGIATIILMKLIL